jgi:hypothetical protein
MVRCPLKGRLGIPQTVKVDVVVSEIEISDRGIGIEFDGFLGLFHSSLKFA